MAIKNQSNFYSGLLFLLVGITFAWSANSYDIGEASAMGPGYFPRLIGCLTLLVGLILMLLSITLPVDEKEGPIGRWAWRPLIYIICANFSFGITLSGIPSMGIPVLGLVVGVYCLTFLSALAGEDFKIKEVTILATILSLMAYGGCVLLLKFNLPIWPEIS